MRSHVLLLAIGLLVTDSVLASPCKPKSSSTAAILSATSTLDTSFEASSETTSLDTTTTTSVIQVSSGTGTYQATTTRSFAEAFSETRTLEVPTTTSVVEVSSGTTTSEATTTTSLEEASSQSAPLETTTTTSIGELSSETTTFEATTTTSVTEASSQTTILETTATSSVVGTTATSDAYTTTNAATEAQTTTNIIITTPSEAETTTTAVAIPSFKLVASGGTVNGLVLQGLESPGSTVMFNPTHPTRVYRPRKYIIEASTGRVKDQDTGIYLCAAYLWSNRVEPAYVALCYGTPGPDQQYNYLNCRTVDGKLSCTVPQAVCGLNALETEIVCKTSSSEVYDGLYHEVVNNKILFIGKGNPGNSYAAVALTVQEA
ncbi:hypothetical protein FIE12Z_1265 [Fusarium flagelliforme]|uniref:Uncharacterized protein n=1 Tax=Fusarium flagelliforme TaxID=2675880 RepID=A0A395N3K4_9HYPO|nr:hypothetical protein FIE12Z_1265 [Fusarium flagelliforme]